MRDRRRNGFSASSGLATRTAGPVSPTSACACSDTKVSVHPSDAPRPHRMSLTARRDRCSGSGRRAGARWAPAAGCCCTRTSARSPRSRRPPRRARAARRAGSSARSRSPGRRRPASRSNTVNPMGSISRAISSRPSSTPIWLCTRAMGTDTTKGSGTSPRTSSMPSATRSPGMLSASSSQNRRTAGSIPQGSTAALEAGRRLGAQAEALGGAGDRHRREVGRLEQHLGGGVGDLRGRAAHDPADAHRRALRVADQAVLAGVAQAPAPHADVRSTPSSVTRISPSRARRTLSPRPGSRARS